MAKISLDPTDKFINSFQSFIYSILEEMFDSKYEELKKDISEKLDNSFEEYTSNIDWREKIEENFEIDLNSMSKDLERFESKLQECEDAIEDVQPVKEVLRNCLNEDDFKIKILSIANGTDPTFEVKKLEEEKNKALKEKSDISAHWIEQFNQKVSEICELNAKIASLEIALKAEKDRSEYLDDRCKKIEAKNEDLSRNLESVRGIVVKF